MNQSITITGIDEAIANIPIYHDLDSLAGTWSDQEANEFLAAVSEFNRVDEKLWQ
jgi:hypothetical protein